ncbi:hypothetical protein JTE90_029331 [Oedothorax gibbosus]|uniref:Uncharacterized protein n=1 Tax=Oedothorax gibbosus TaxID=931172 RepID=A0AAV6UH09_9ARAC|nr:hypothetical protein JTE90_029331 [Oedothorax gibbosus]
MESRLSFKTPVTDFSAKDTSSSDNFQFLHPQNVTKSSNQSHRPECTSSSGTSSRTPGSRKDLFPRGKWL